MSNLLDRRMALRKIGLWVAALAATGVAATAAARADTSESSQEVGEGHEDEEQRPTDELTRGAPARKA